MRMTGYFERSLEKYGNTVTLSRDGRTEVFKAFVLPLRRRHRLYINDRYVPAGYFDNRYLLYIGPCSHPLTTGMLIGHNGMKCSVVTAEEFTSHNEDIYVWAILMPESKAEEGYYDDYGG